MESNGVGSINFCSSIYGDCGQKSSDQLTFQQKCQSYTMRLCLQVIDQYEKMFMFRRFDNWKNVSFFFLSRHKLKVHT